MYILVILMFRTSRERTVRVNDERDERTNQESDLPVLDKPRARSDVSDDAVELWSWAGLRLNPPRCRPELLPGSTQIFRSETAVKCAGVYTFLERYVSITGRLRIAADKERTGSIRCTTPPTLASASPRPSSPMRPRTRPMHATLNCLSRVRWKQ
jgi:hypothetical protein